MMDVFGALAIAAWAWGIYGLLRQIIERLDFLIAEEDGDDDDDPDDGEKEDHPDIEQEEEVEAVHKKPRLAA